MRQSRALDITAPFTYEPSGRIPAHGLLRLRPPQQRRTYWYASRPSESGEERQGWRALYEVTERYFPITLVSVERGDVNAESGWEEKIRQMEVRVEQLVTVLTRVQNYLGVDEEGTYSDDALNWCDANAEQLATLPDSFVAIDPQSGIVYSESDPVKFNKWLAERSNEERTKLLTTHTSLYK